MTFNIYIGFDEREEIAYDVCKYSIERRASVPINIIALKHRELRKQGLFRRPWITNASDGIMIDGIDGKPFSTNFSHTRFLVPKLNDYKGWALFMDCDMIFKCDIKYLIEQCNNKHAIMCVKHSQKVDSKTKMDDQRNESYFRKNWSSFVLWNCGHELNKRLTPEMVNYRSGSELHQFDWIPDGMIGSLSPEYNWIEGTSPAIDDPKVIHYSLGGPWFKDNPKCQDVMFADQWWNELEHYQKYNPKALVCL